MPSDLMSEFTDHNSTNQSEDINEEEGQSTLLELILSTIGLFIAIGILVLFIWNIFQDFRNIYFLPIVNIVGMNLSLTGLKYYKNLTLIGVVLNFIGLTAQTIAIILSLFL